jgi:hypothetical protein
MISDGWMFMNPSGIQRRAPLTLRPMPGISTTTRPTTPSRNSGSAQRCQIASGIWNTA